MTLETFFDKFDRFADAPGAVGKMRELVLELAIQGKLVEQSDDDEPARRQLERIAEKKSEIGRVVRVKAGKTGSASPNETNTHVPSGWEKASVAQLVTVLNGRAYSKDELLAAGTPVLRVGNLFTSKHWYYSDLQLEPDKYCDKGDLIFAWSASFGPFIWPGPKVIYHYHIWKLELHSEADLHKGYLYWFLQNKTQEIKRAGHGVSMLHMTKEKMEKLEVMLPPLAEQKRIVAKVDELMALCDRLDAQQREREERGAALARASLTRFADAPNPANLDFLFHKSYAIPPADLRKSILTLAVQGKLVPQDPEDEAVEDSVRTARKKAGFAVRALSELASDETPFEVPESWRWITVADVADTRLGKMLDKEKNRGEAHPYLRNTNVHWFRFELDSIKTMPFKSTELKEYCVKSGDVLICEGGHGIARSAVWDGQIPGIMFQKALHRVRPLSCLNGHFLTFCLWVYERDGILQRYYTGAGIPHFTGKALARVTFPLPPLAEQRRIVAKVDQLMSLVDELETQLAASRATAAKLLSALVAELTSQ
jgi:type I restriction enzyme S subunit